VLKGDPATEVRKLKQESGSNITVLGSGSIVSQLTQAGLIDEYQLVLNPVIIGRGKSLFRDVTGTKPLRLKTTRAFGNGNVVLSYEQAGRA
jgi:dihydrofolate reductase